MVINKLQQSTNTTHRYFVTPRPRDVDERVCSGRYPGLQVLTHRLPMNIHSGLGISPLGVYSIDAPALAYRCGGS